MTKLILFKLNLWPIAKGISSLIFYDVFLKRNGVLQSRQKAKMVSFCYRKNYKTIFWVNKFYLLVIFTESSESSDDDESSSEEEEDDTKSIDSNDVTAIRLDETHCPPGLDRAMYDLAFKLRSDRHELERALIEANKQIDIKREEVKVATINVSRHTDVYNKERETLITFRVSCW